MHITLPSDDSVLDLVGADLGASLRQGTRVVAYQPVLDLCRAQVVAVEAVLSRPHSAGGQLDPALLCDLDRFVLDTATAQVAAWHQKGLTLELTIAVSRALLGSPSFDPVLQNALAGSGLDPRKLVLDVPETALDDDDRRVAAALARARDLGAGVAVNGYGTGFSTPAQLQQHHLTAVKLDPQLVAGLGSDPDADGLVSTVSGMSGLLGVHCVAVGVERVDQHRRLVHLGCQRAQGLLYGEAVPGPRLPAQVDACEARAAELAAAPPRGAQAQVAERVQETMARMWEAGASVQTIAAALNRMGSRHPSGRRWHGTSVGRSLADAARTAKARAR